MRNKMRNKKFRISISIIIMIIIMLFSFVGNTYALGNKTQNTTKENVKELDPGTSFSDIISEDGSQMESGIKRIKKERKIVNVNYKSDLVKENETFDAEFSFKDNVKDYYFVEEGIKVITHNKSNKKIDLNLLAKDQFGRLEMYVDYGDGEYHKQCLYTYTTAGKTFISDTGEDDAWKKGLNYKYDNKLISLDEYQEEFSELCSRSVIYTSNTSRNINAEPVSTNNTTLGDVTINATTTTVSGRLGWRLPNGTSMPLKLIKVELYVYIKTNGAVYGSSVKLGETYTDINGNYNFSVSHNYPLNIHEIYINVIPRSYTFKITDILTVDYDFHSSHVDLNTTNINISFDFTYSEDSTINKVFYLSQAAVNAQRFAQQMGMTDNYAFIRFPTWTTITDTSMCTGKNIFVVGNDWKDWDTITHEYGHFVQKTMGITPFSFKDVWDSITDLDFDFVKFSHYSDTDHLNDKIQYGADFAMKLAYSEAWATAFAQIAQEHYKSEYQNVPGACDRTDGVNYSTYSPTAQSGEAQEDAIIAFLWDLYSDYRIGAQGFWSVTTVSGIYTMTQLAARLDTAYRYIHYKTSIGKYYGDNQIAPSNFTILNSNYLSEITSPKFQWKINGTCYNPNKYFCLEFYDGNSNLIYKTSKIYLSNLDNASFVTLNPSTTYSLNAIYTLPLNEWKTVQSLFNGDTIYTFVKGGWYSGSIYTGPYTSSRAYISSNTYTAERNNINSNPLHRYYEKVISLNPGEHRDLVVKFKVACPRVLQTFGTKDVVLELLDMNGNRLAYNDDSGYSLNPLIYYNHFTANTEYFIRVRFFSSTQSGDIRLAIVPTYTHSTFENMYTYNDYYGNVNWSLAVNSVATLVYKYSTTKTVTFTTSSNYDTFLYVIDPRSTEPISSDFSRPSVYNDDGGGNYQAKITKTMEANVPYIVIISFYSPSSTSGTLSIISKQ